MIRVTMNQMSHLRNRFAIRALLKKLKFSRVVSIQGARQTGKSTLARELLKRNIPTTEYVTFDKALDKRMATEQPDSFLEAHSDAFPLAIDEAQKVPDIFDAVKYRVDIDSKPGRYLLLGSTEFSREVQVKESLTGRLSRLMIYPLTVSESLNLPFEYRLSFKTHHPEGIKPRINRKLFLRYLEHGGFPGLFAIRSDDERKNLTDDWIKLVSGRDLMQFKNFKADPELAGSILELLPHLETPDLNSLCKKIRQNGKKIKTHLDLLEQLFAIHSVNRHALGTGKKLYFLCDVGLVSHFGGDLKRKIQTWLQMEIRAQCAYSMTLKTCCHYYRSSRGGRIDFVIDNENESENEIFAIKVFDTEKIDRRDFEILSAFKKKMTPQTKKNIRLIALGPYLKIEKIKEIELFPWEIFA